MSRASNFESLVRPELAHALRQEFGIVAPNAIQADAIPFALSGRDLMVCAQTGSGKTLVFLLPILQRLLDRTSEAPALPEALILAPSEQLAMQVSAVARQLARSLPDSISIALLGEGARSPRKARLLIGTADLALQCWDSSSAGQGLCMLAVDEADALLCNAGERAEDDASALQRRAAKELLRRLEGRMPQMFLTMAHLTEAREDELVCRFPQAQRVGHVGVLVPTLRQCFHYFRGDKDAKLLQLLADAEEEDSEPPAGATMVFCGCAAAAEKVKGLLEEEKPSRQPLALHEGTPAAQRADIASRFREGKAQVLVATDGAARGLDFPRVRHVIMYDVPVDATAFVHCAGRTARRGNTGLVTCIVEAGDAGRYQFDGKCLHALKDAPQLSFSSVGPGDAAPTEMVAANGRSRQRRGRGGYRQRPWRPAVGKA
eukprot:TRINITY_DN7367_c0_g1_i1.p1 TRINITY_DN7367_c0_g1~~TRINITY_DN7367_c0_g1_i1.p1  ORF type:complete len:431 (-),score=94.56 TRINITY_DN7367_c0_g1_i1:51-1343(-)